MAVFLDCRKRPIELNSIDILNQVKQVRDSIEDKSDWKTAVTYAFDNDLTLAYEWIKINQQKYICGTIYGFILSH